MRSSVRSRLAPPSFLSLATALFPKHVPLRSNSIDHISLQMLELGVASCCHHLHHLRNRALLAFRYVLGVDIEGGCNSRMPHLSLHIFGICSCFYHPGRTGSPQR